MGIYESSYLFWGCAVGETRGDGAATRLFYNPEFRADKTLKAYTTDFGGKLVLHAPSKIVRLSSLDARHFSTAYVTKAQCRQMLSAPPHEFPGAPPVGLSEDKIDALLDSPGTEQVDNLTRLCSLAGIQGPVEMKWWYLVVMSTTYGGGPTFTVLPVVEEL